MRMVKVVVSLMVYSIVFDLDPFPWLKSAVLLALLACPLMGRAATLDLQCRQGQQGWMRCQLNQPRPGEHWFLSIGDERIEFRHDGSGRMRMRHGRDEAWVSVEPRWSADQSLCWGDVCARGELPLD